MTDGRGGRPLLVADQRIRTFAAIREPLPSIRRRAPDV